VLHFQINSDKQLFQVDKFLGSAYLREETVLITK